jgi:hypothetical protein
MNTQREMILMSLCETLRVSYETPEYRRDRKYAVGSRPFLHIDNAIAYAQKELAKKGR